MNNQQHDGTDIGPKCGLQQKGVKNVKMTNITSLAFFTDRKMKVLHFHQKTVMNSFMIYLSDNMGLIPKELARIKYPSEFRPRVLLTTLKNLIYHFRRKN